MRHGDVESTRERKGEGILPSASARAKAEDFGRAVSKIAATQICEGVGYEGFKESALESIADIAIRYLCDLGKTSTFYASLAGRTQCNLFDIIQSLEDLVSPQGLDHPRCCVVGSAAMREIIEFVDSNEEVPFSQPIPCFPICRSRKMIPSFLQMGETPPGKHIPTWLPALPDPHTFVHTPTWNERVSDARADKLEQARQKRKAEKALLNLQKRLVCNGCIGTSSGVLIDEEKEPRESGGNPFLEAPLEPGKKDVSVIRLPGKLSGESVKEGQISVREAFAPVVEAAKRGEFWDGAREEKFGFLQERRHSVQFKIGTGKKFLGESFDLKMQRKSDGKRPFSLREDEKDDKKRRAEFILRQSMENPWDLNQS